MSLFSGLYDYISVIKFPDPCHTLIGQLPFTTIYPTENSTFKEVFNLFLRKSSYNKPRLKKQANCLLCKTQT